MGVVVFGVDAVAPAPFLEIGAGGVFAGVWLLVEPAATDEVLHDDSSLPAVAVFEADDDHAVALQAAPPAAVAVLGADTAGCNEFGVAGRADVVIAGEGARDFAGAGEAVVAGLGRLDGIATDVAFGGEG